MNYTDHLSKFDLAESMRLAEEGIALAAENGGSAVLRVQQIARELGRKFRFINADSVRYECLRRGISQVELERIGGSMFRTKGEWRKTVNYSRSSWIPAHGRMLPDWEYIGK